MEINKACLSAVVTEPVRTKRGQATIRQAKPASNSFKVAKSLPVSYPGSGIYDAATPTTNINTAATANRIVPGNTTAARKTAKVLARAYSIKSIPTNSQ